MSSKFSLNVKDFKKTGRDSGFYLFLTAIWAIIYPIIERFLPIVLQSLSTADLAVYGIYGAITVGLSQLALRYFKERK